MLIERFFLVATHLFFPIANLLAQVDYCRILDQPSSIVVAGETFRIQPRIKSFSNVRIEPANFAQVWAQLSNHQENIGLYGQRFANVIDGVAQFTNLYVSGPADGLQLTFNCTISGLSVDSEPLQVQKPVSKFFVNNSIYLSSAPVGRFVINRINGVLCPVPLIVQATPGSAVASEDCSTSGNIENVSIMLPYLLPDRMYEYTAEDEINVCPSFPNCAVTLNCSMSATTCPINRVYPSVALIDSSGNRVSATALPVTVALNPLAGGDETPLIGKITENSCCTLAHCEAYGGLCCNCSDPACAVCVIPSDGVVSFPGLKAVKAGQYEMIFSAMRQLTSKDGSNSWDVLSSRYDAHIQIIPGRSDSLTLDEESTFTAKLGYDDESGLVNQQPVVEVVDRYKNKGAFSVDAESVLALPCEDSEINGGVLCSCTNLSCLRPSDLDSAMEYALKAFDGQISAEVVSSKARFTNLRIFLSAPKMRISFWFFRKGMLGTSLPAISGSFSVSPGALSHIILVDEPAIRKGCERCPKGVHMANNSLPVEMILYDVFNNPISFCESPNLACSGMPSSKIAFKICIPSKNSFSEILPSTIETVARAKNGIVRLTDLRIDVQNSNYSLLFYVVDDTGPRMDVRCNSSQNNSLILKSMPFAISNNAPARLHVVGSNSTIIPSVESVDLEPLPSDIAVEILDAFGNSIMTNCYSACEKTSMEFISCYGPLSILQNSCSLNVSVSSTATKNTLEVLGTLEEFSQNGFAIFTNLALMSSLSSSCDNHSTSYLLKFDAPPANPAYVEVILNKPVHNITVDIQPSEVSARESFFPHPQISSRDCHNNFVNSRNYISVQIAQNAGYGTLEGRTLVQMRSGIAVFTDLSIDLTGVNYALEFRYVGLFGNSYNIPSVVSDRFDVFLPIPRLEFVPGTALNGSVALAGLPFQVQPRIQVFIRDGQLDSSTSIEVTAVIGKNPGDKQPHDPEQSSLLGTVNTKVWNGVAVFTDLSLTKASLGQNIGDNSGYTLIFTVGDVRVESGYIHVIPSNLSALWIPANLQPSVLPSEAGRPFVIQPIVLFVDRFNNRVASSQIPKRAEVGVMILKDLNFNNTLLQHPGLKDIFLLRDSQITNCTGCCTGDRPIICKMPANMKIQEIASETGVVSFTDLRIDIASDSYRLVFYMINMNRVQNTTSIPFVVTNTVPSYPKVIQTLTDVNIADMPLIRQPIVTVVDRFENTITYDNVPNRTVRVVLHPPMSYWVSLSTGQLPGTVCKLLPKDSILAGTLEVPVDLKRGWGVFTDLFVQQALNGYMLEFAMKTSVGVVYVNTSIFSVQSGTTTSICAIGIPTKCSAGGSCLSYIDVVCVDSFGNINITCKTRLGSQAGVPMCGGAYNASCLTVTLKTRPLSPIDCLTCPAQVGQQCLCSQGLNQILPCTSKPGGMSQWASYTCKTGIMSGRSIFTDLTFYKAGNNYSLVFTTFVRDDWFKQEYMWSTESQLFDVTPTPPSIMSTYVADSLNELYIRFDRATNMPTTTKENLCSVLLEETFFKSLGQDPKCLWVQPDQLQVTLGKGAYINETTQVLLNAGSNIISQELINGVILDSLPATTVEGVIINGKSITRLFPQLPSVILSPVPVIIAPSELTACDLIQADGRLSTGNLGRGFTEIKWGLNFEKSKLDVGILATSHEPNFDKRVVAFSSYLPGEVNHITVTLRPNAPVLPGTRIVISGLPSLASCKTFNSDADCLQIYNSSNTQVCCPTSPLYGPGSVLFAGLENVSTIEWFNDTQWILKVGTTKFISESNDTIFSFQIINPFSIQRNYVMIEGSCDECMCSDDECVQTQSFVFPRNVMQMNCNGLCSNPTAAVFEIKDYTISLQAGSISESCNVSGAINFLSVRINPSHDLPPGSVLVIGGLNGSTTRSGYLCLYGLQSNIFQQNVCVEKGTHAPSAFWNSSSAELRLTVRPGQKILGTETSIFSFQLQNSFSSNRKNCLPQAQLLQQQCESWARATIQFVYPTDFSRIAKKFSLSGDVLGSGGSFKFLRVSVSESNSIVGAKNMLTFFLQANALVPAKTQIRLSGLSQLDWFQKHSSSTISVYNTSGQPSLCFDNAVKQGKDILLVVLDSCYGNLPSSSISPITFAIEVTNEKQQQAPVQLLLSAQYSALRSSFSITQQIISGLILESSVLARFDNFSIHESNSLIGQLNTLSVAFKCSVPLLAGSIVTIGGLANTISSVITTKTMQIFGPQFTALENQTSFDLDAGTLEVNLTHSLLKDTLYNMEIFVRNGLVPKPETAINNITISARVRVASESFITTLIRGSMSGSLLMRGRATASASITELTKVSNAYNVLTITIRANFDLQGPDSSITVHGLSNSQIPFANVAVIDSEKLLTSDSEFYSVFPNCSCSLYEYQNDGACLDPCPPAVAPALSSQARLTGVDSGLNSVLSEYGANWEKETQSEFCDKSSQRCGRLVFSLEVGRIIPAGEDLVVRFIVLNAEAAVAPSFPAISIKPIQPRYNLSIVGPFLAATLNNLGVISSNESPRFLSSTISFDSSVPGYATKIQVKFQTNCPLISPGTPAYIKLSGFRGIKTASGLISIYGSESFLVSKSAVADLDSEAGTLTLLGGSVTSIKEYSFNFFLVGDPRLMNSSNVLVIAAQSNAVVIGPQNFKVVTKVESRTFPPEESPTAAIQVLNIAESSNLQGVSNTITIEFISNIRLFPSSTITFIGLVNSDSENSDQVSIFGTNASFFGFGLWDRVQGSLALTVSAEQQVAPNILCSISFTIKNPSKPVNAFTRIETSGEVTYGGQLAKIPIGVFLSPVFRANETPKFLTAFMHESNTVNGAINTITITLEANIEFVVGGVLVLHTEGNSGNLDFGSRPIISVSGPSAIVFNDLSHNINGDLHLSFYQYVPPGKQLVVAVSARNRICNASESCYRDITVFYDGGASAPTVRTSITRFSGRRHGVSITDGGSLWSWIDKYVTQSSAVRNAMNKLTFTLRPNAPLFPGSVIVVRGVRDTQSSSCHTCIGRGDRISGLGCSNECLQCRGACLPVWNNGSQPHDSFLNSVADWNKENGTLRFTLNMVMNELHPTIFSVYLRNSNYSGRGKECNPNSTLLDIAQGMCLTVIVEKGVFVPPEADFDPPKNSWNPYDISSVDSYNIPLMDSCTTCLRPEDLVAFDKAMGVQDSLILNQIPIFSPSVSNLPILRAGVPAPGQYALALRLSNWIGLRGESSFLISIASPQAAIKPLVVINASAAIKIQSQQSLQLIAHGSSPICAATANLPNLRYLWKIVCQDGPCNLLPALEGISPSINQNILFIRANSLPPGGKYALKCIVSNAVESAEAAVIVTVEVRPLVVSLVGISIGGAASQDRAYTLSAEVFDPEELTRPKNTSQPKHEFQVSWACNQTSISYDSPTPCSFDFFSPNKSIAVVNTAFFQPGLRYIIAVQASRNVNILPTAFSALVSASKLFGHVSLKQFILSSDCNNLETDLDCTQIIRGDFTVVSLKLCDVEEVGSLDFCERVSQNSKVSANKKLFLRATATSREGGSFAKFSWSIRNNTKNFVPLNNNPLLEMPSSSSWLVLNVGALVSGSKSTSFRVSVLGSNVFQGFATLTLRVSTAPYGGDFSVQPMRGEALETFFSLNSVGWSADLEDLPLSYRFFYVVNSGTRFYIFIAAGYGAPTTMAGVYAQLPMGNPRQNYKLEVGVIVSNAFDATSTVLASAFVLKSSGPVVTQTMLLQFVQSLVSVSTYEQLDGAANVAETLNAISILCHDAIDDNTRTVCRALTSGSQIRGNILGILSSADMLMSIETRDLLFLALKIVASNAFFIQEMDTSEVRTMMMLLHRYSDLTSKMRIDTSDVADILCNIISQLLAWFSEISNARLLSRRSTVEKDDVRVLMQSISNISSLSVRQALSGMNPIVLNPLSSLRMTTFRLSSKDFQGISTNDFGFGAKLVLPSNNFFDLFLSPPPDMEIMLLAINKSVSPFPNSISDIIAIEIREFGSSEPLLMSKQLLFPAVLTIPTKQAGEGMSDSIAGTKQVPFMASFDTDTWAWSTTGIQLLTTDNMTVTGQTHHLSYFASLLVTAGCDRIPLSGVVLDKCGVCGGNDETCSGCDGVPNTGRNKSCSGHGLCGVQKCICNPDCKEYSCSGHGICNPQGQGQVLCLCSPGWSGIGTFSKTYCAFELALNESNVKKSADSGISVIWLALMVSLPTAAFIGLCFLWLYLFRPKRNQLLALRSSLLDPVLKSGKQKQDIFSGSNMPHNDRSTAALGLLEPEHLITTAKFCHGPNSQHLVSAIASNPLNPLAQAQVEHIALRTKVFESAISSSRTIQNYMHGPSRMISGNDLFDWEENEPPFAENQLEVEKQRVRRAPQSQELAATADLAPDLDHQNKAVWHRTD